MVQAIGNRKEKGVIRSLDYWTIIIYIALLSFGWVSVCGASYSYGDTDLFSLDTRSGMQIVWIGTSIVLGFVILMLDDRYLDMFAYIIFGVMLILLFGTIFNPHSIKGSRSWLVLGPIRLQPAEFAKFATALALAKLMNTYGFNIGKWKDFGLTLAVIFIPMLFIVMQRETGSALVYLSFFLMLYREGMPGSILFTGVAMVVYFVVGIRFADVMMGITPTSIGKFAVLMLVQIFSAGLCVLQREARHHPHGAYRPWSHNHSIDICLFHYPVRCQHHRDDSVCGHDILSALPFPRHTFPQLSLDYGFCAGLADVL